MMNKKIIENIIFITGMILFIPPILVHIYYKETNLYLLWIFCSLIPLSIGVFFLKLIFAKNDSISHLWQLEGFTTFFEWFKKSNSHFGKLFRFSIKIFIPILFGASMIIAIILSVISND